jgi:GntR family histidine utilization transcriptional repressor
MKPEALHSRIHATIEGRILSGEWEPGRRVPSEAELMAEYGCARMTVNKALSVLAGAGLIERRKGAGSFVARPRARSLVLDVPDLAVEIAARGQAYAYRLLHQALAGDLPDTGLAGPVLQLVGLHSADGASLAWEERWVSLPAVPTMAQVDFSHSPPGSWLLHHTPWTEAEHRIGAAAAEADCAAALGVAPGTACLTVERRTWRGGEGITLVRQYFLAGHYELVARFGPRQAAAAPSTSGSAEG